MLRYSDCNDTSLVGVDNVLDFTLPRERVPGFCNVSQAGINAYIVLGSLLVTVRCLLTSLHWWLWFKRERQLKHIGKQQQYHGRKTTLPVFPLLSLIGFILMILFIVLTYLGMANARDGTSIMLVDLFYLPLTVMGVLMEKKNAAVRIKLASHASSSLSNRCAHSASSVGFSVIFLISFFVGIMSVSVDAGNARWFIISFMNFTSADIGGGYAIVASLEKVKAAVRSRPNTTQRAKGIANRILVQQIALIAGFVPAAVFWTGISFWWAPSWPFALFAMSLDTGILSALTYSSHMKSKKSAATPPRGATGAGEVLASPAMNSPLADPVGAPSSMFLAVSTTNIVVADEIMPVYQFRTVAVPLLDTVMAHLGPNPASALAGTSGLTVLTALAGVVLALISLFNENSFRFAVSGGVLLMTAHISVLSMVICLAVFARLTKEPSIWMRCVLLLVWVFNMFDVVDWDFRCLSITGLFLLWLVTCFEDAAVEKAKFWVFPTLSLFAVASSLVTLVALKFDLLFTRSDHALVVVVGENAVSWSTYQAAGDFNIAVLGFLLYDAFHVISRRGLTHLLHIKGVIHVCIAPLDVKPSVASQELESMKIDPTTITSSPAEPAVPMMMRQMSAVGQVLNNNHLLVDVANVVVRRGLLTNKLSSIPVSTVVLRERDSFAVRLLGQQRGSQFLYALGQPVLRTLSVWIFTVPVTIWVGLVLPGIISPEYSLLSIMTLLILVRNLLLKNVYMVRVIVGTRKFWLRTLLLCLSFGSLAHMLFWDIRVFTVAVFVLLGVDYQLSDARCVFFVKSAKRSYDLKHWTARVSDKLFLIGSLLFLATVVALPVVISLGMATNARMGAFIPLRSDVVPTTSTSPGMLGSEISRGTLARLNLFQVVSDCLVGLCFVVAFDLLQDLRLARKNKTRRIQLKGFHAYVHPVFVESDHDSSAAQTAAAAESFGGSFIQSPRVEDEDDAVSSIQRGDDADEKVAGDAAGEMTTTMVLEDGTTVYFTAT